MGMCQYKGGGKEMKKDNTTEMVEWQSSLGGMPSSLSRRDKGKIKNGHRYESEKVPFTGSLFYFR